MGGESRGMKGIRVAMMSGMTVSRLKRIGRISFITGYALPSFTKDGIYRLYRLNIGIPSARYPSNQPYIPVFPSVLLRPLDGHHDSMAADDEPPCAHVASLAGLLLVDLAHGDEALAVRTGIAFGRERQIVVVRRAVVRVVREVHQDGEDLVLAHSASFTAMGPLWPGSRLLAIKTGEGGLLHLKGDQGGDVAAFLEHLQHLHLVGQGASKGPCTGAGKAVILVRRIEPVALCGYALPQPSPWRRSGPTRPQRACQQGLTSIQYRLGFI